LAEETAAWLSDADLSPTLIGQPIENSPMQNYTGQQTYIDVKLGKDDFEQVPVPRYARVQVEPLHPIYKHTEVDFSESMLKYPTLPLFVGKFQLAEDHVAGIDANLLRLMIRTNESDSDIFLPKSVSSLAPLILQNINYHRQFFLQNEECFIYLTVRVCDFNALYYKNSADWHIDGYQGARIARHRVEQNMFWSNLNPTEFSLQPFFCEGINPRLHDINDFINRTANEQMAVAGIDNGVYFVTPFHVHRVCPRPFEGKRVFVRLNFSPVLIEDQSNSVNPWFDRIRFPKRYDVRNFLHSYEIDEVANFGVVPKF
jgi:hypothetical protein